MVQSKNNIFFLFAQLQQLKDTLPEMKTKLAWALSLASEEVEQSERVAAGKRKVEETETVLKGKAELRKSAEEEEKRVADQLARDRRELSRAEATLNDIRQNHAYRTEVKSTAD